MQAVLDRLRHVEVGLADRQVDRILHLRGQVEDLANAAGVEGTGAVGEEGHGGAFRIWGSDIRHLLGRLLTNLHLLCVPAQFFRDRQRIVPAFFVLVDHNLRALVQQARPLAACRDNG